MKNFLFDLTASQPNSDGEFHGGGKYAKKVFVSLHNSTEVKEWKIFASYDSRVALDDEIRKYSESKDIMLIDISSVELSQVIKEFSITRYYSALPKQKDYFDSNTCQFIGTIHGLRALEISMSYDALKYFPSLKEKLKSITKILFNHHFIKKYDLYYRSLLKDWVVVTVSQHTRFSIQTYFPDLKKNIPVFYSPDVTEFDDELIDENCLSFDEKDYFLLVSGNRWLKNNFRSIQALDQIFSENSNIKNRVIVTGVGDPSIYLQEIKNKDRFIFYKYVSESFLALLYKNAYAFIYMSLNEGFGYPPLESMKVGVPVIAAPFTSIPEICSDAALYSNPYSVSEIKNRIFQILDRDIHSNMSQKALDRYNYVKDIQESDLTSMVNYLFSSNW